MKSHVSKVSKQFLAGCLAAMVLCLGLFAASLNEKTTESLRTVCAYLPFPERLASLLDEYDIPWPLPQREIAQWPAVRRLAYGYLAAERAKDGSGKSFISEVAQTLAERNLAMRYDAKLEPFLKAALGDVRLEFVRGPPPEANMRLPADIREAITAISGYCEISHLGSKYDIFVNHLGLSGDAAFSILMSSSSHEEAFIRAFESLPSEDVALAKLSGLVRKVGRRNFAIHYESTLASFLGPDFRPPNDFGTSGPFGGPPDFPSPPSRPSPPSAPVLSRATENYMEVRKENLRFGTSFKEMRATPRGFGGILFGNSVTSSLPRPKSVRFESAGQDQFGSLLMTFNDGTKLRLPNVRSDDAYSAYRILSAPLEGLDPPKLGEGIGLVGVKDNLPFAERNGTNGILTGSQYRVVLHPALLNTDLGWSLISVDIAPINEGGLLRSPNVTNDAPFASDLQQLWEKLDQNDNLGTWKVVDVPMTIAAEQDSTGVTNLVVARQADPRENYPDGLRHTAFVEMAPYRSAALSLDDLDRKNVRDNGLSRELSNTETTDREFAATFYRHLPLLVVSSYDYRRVNEFARVLAVVRWAIGNGAEFSPEPPPRPPSNVATPEAIKLTEERLVSIPYYSNIDVERKRLWAEADHLASDLVMGNEDVKRFASDSKKFNEDILQAFREYLDAEGVDTEKALKAKEKRLDAKKGLSELSRQSRSNRLVKDYLTVVETRNILKSLENEYEKP